MNHLRYITRDPRVCGGDYIIRGTRITLRTVLANLAAGLEYDAMHRSYPAINNDIFQSIVAFAAAAAEDDEPLVATTDDPFCTNCLPFNYRVHFDKPDPTSPVVIRATDISLRSLLARIAAGESAAAILAAHRGLTPEDLRAVIAFAAASAVEDMPYPGLPPECGGAMALLAKLDEHAASDAGAG